MAYAANSGVPAYATLFIRNIFETFLLSIRHPLPNKKIKKSFGKFWRIKILLYLCTRNQGNKVAKFKIFCGNSSGK